MVKFYKIIVVACLKMDSLSLYISGFVFFFVNLLIMMFKMLKVQAIH